MSFQFTITGLGLQVDKTMILPGSTLLLSGPAPSHWARFGNAGGNTLVVATPEAAVSADDAAEAAVSADKPRRGRSQAAE